MSGLPYYDRKCVDLGMFGESAECLLVDWRGYGGATRRRWIAHIRTTMNNCDGWGETPEQAVRDAMQGRISSLKVSLAELQLFMNATDCEVAS